MNNKFFLDKCWMSSVKKADDADIIMIGIPYDGTCSYRPGTRFGPEAIRTASYGLEEYSPLQEKSLNSVKFYDAGELDLPFGNRTKVLKIIKDNARRVFQKGKRYFGIGGEHLVTLPAIEAAYEVYPDLSVIHFDAHADLRDDYLGEKLSHATVMRRVVDKIGIKNLYQVGIRSGTEEEFQLIKKHKTLLKDPCELDKFVNRPVFVSIDLDVIDPSLMKGTGTPEPGGLSYNELMSWLLPLKYLNIVGCDVLELAPNYDTSGVSTITAAKVIREMLLLI